MVLLKMYVFVVNVREGGRCREGEECKPIWESQLILPCPVPVHVHYCAELHYYEMRS